MNQIIRLPELDRAEIQLAIKREDLLHPVISGNKYRKLKYNLLEAKARGCHSILTFGGAYSNHILATACAGHEQGFKTIGVIRGDELKTIWHRNPTLRKAADYGMEFCFVSRTAYRLRNRKNGLARIKSKYGEAFIIPEGGNNTLGIKGCTEILEEGDDTYDVVCCAVGTGATLAGLAATGQAHQTIIGYSALKGSFLEQDLHALIPQRNWKLNTSYHFGGYARTTDQLIDFINRFYRKTGVLLDPIYTGKLFFGIFDGISTGKFKRGCSILAIHTGGLQGIEAFNLKQNQKQLTQILI